MRSAAVIKTCLTGRYCSFTGRMPRADFGVYMAFTAVLNAAGYAVIELLNLPDFISWVTLIAAQFLPLVGAVWRRLHDSGRSGQTVALNLGLILISLGFYEQWHREGADYWRYCMYAAIALSLVYLAVNAFLLCRRGSPRPNRYGVPPLR